MFGGFFWAQKFFPKEVCADNRSIDAYVYRIDVYDSLCVTYFWFEFLAP